MLPRRQGTGNVGVLTTGEAQVITGIQVSFLLLFAFALQVALAEPMLTLA
nr:hypothetical protein [Pseudomonas syringae]